VLRRIYPEINQRTIVVASDVVYSPAYSMNALLETVVALMTPCTTEQCLITEESFFVFGYTERSSETTTALFQSFISNSLHLKSISFSLHGERREQIQNGQNSSGNACNELIESKVQDYALWAKCWEEDSPPEIHRLPIF
jgi:hypothetical protein